MNMKPSSKEASTFKIGGPFAVTFSIPQHESMSSVRVQPFDIAKRRYPGHDAGASFGNPILPSKSIEEPARQVPLYGEYDVVVLGGGPAGIAAAVAAARAGRAHAADRALWFSRRHGHGRGGHEFLRAACQCPWGDAPRGAGDRLRPIGANRSARRAQRAASHSRENLRTGL